MYVTHEIHVAKKYSQGVIFECPLCDFVLVIQYEPLGYVKLEIGDKNAYHVGSSGDVGIQAVRVNPPSDPKPDPYLDPFEDFFKDK